MGMELDGNGSWALVRHLVGIIGLHWRYLLIAIAMKSSTSTLPLLCSCLVMD
jgi:hypothetical protein